VVGGASRKLRDDAGAWEVSPDGKWIAFSTNRGKCGDREVWLMGPDGENARKLFFELDEHNGIVGGVWSPDGHRLLYGRLVCSSEAANAMEEVIESRDLNGGPAVSVLRPVPSGQDGGVRDFWWLPDGRVLYVLGEQHGPTGDTCNYWEIRVDERTGKPRGEPRQLTNWAGFSVDNTAASGDGKRVTFRKSSYQCSTYVADLESNGNSSHQSSPVHEQ
jgi:Tol biopolymer transport system component